MTSERTTIRKLRKKFPKMTCKKGCSGCCGPIVFSKWEWGRVPHLIATSLQCPYWKDGCSIYEERPILCRAFGTIAEDHPMKCPKGCHPANPLTEKEFASLMGEYIRLFHGPEYMETMDHEWEDHYNTGIEHAITDLAIKSLQEP